MKKTIPTSIANTLFYIEEDTYPVLDKYLESIRAHFATYDDSIEIIRDIESRIAEQFIEYVGGSATTKDRIITASHVERLMKSMGMPEDFDDGSDAHTTDTRKNTTNNRKLYRDTDNAIIAGVASGIGAYFSIDPLFVRIIFFISTFLGGARIFIYLFLWLVVPAATTATQKLEMQGDPVTLHKVSEMMREKLNEIDREKARGRVRGFFHELRIFIGKVLKRILPLIGGIIGIAIKIVTATALIGIVAVFIIGLMNPITSLISFPLAGVVTLPLYYIVMTALFLASFIPFMFVYSLGNALLKKKSIFSPKKISILIGTWFVAIAVLFISALSFAGMYKDYLATNPIFQQTSKTITPEAFEKIEAHNGQRVTITSGEEYLITINGRGRDIDRLDISNTDGTLVIKNKLDDAFCFFCGSRATDIHITVPALSSISASNASRISYDGTAEALDISLANASTLTLTGTTPSLHGTIENGSHLEGSHLIAQNVELNLANASRAEINAVATLIINASNASKITQYGPASTENVHLNNASTITKEELNLIEHE